jgi:hypothetical protein
VPASAHESLLAAREQLSSLKGSAYAVVRNTAVIGGRSPARRIPLPVSTSKASMHSSLRGTLARTIAGRRHASRVIADGDGYCIIQTH